MFKERAWRSVFYTAALLGVSACSAKTGGSPPGGTAGSGGASSVPPAGGLSGNGTGAGGFLTGAGDGMGGALIGSVGMPRPVDMGNGPDGSCGELPFSAEQVTKMNTVTHDVPQPIDLYIMWDQSLSMTCAVPTGGGGAGGMPATRTPPPDRWGAVEA